MQTDPAKILKTYLSEGFDKDRSKLVKANDRRRI